MRKYNLRTSWNMQSSMQYDWADPDGSFVLAPEGKAEGKWCKIEPLRSLLTVVPLDETTMHRFPAGLANTHLEIKTTFANIRPLKKSCLTTCFVFFFGGGTKNKLVWSNVLKKFINGIYLPVMAQAIRDVDHPLGKHQLTGEPLANFGSSKLRSLANVKVFGQRSGFLLGLRFGFDF